MLSLLLSLLSLHTHRSLTCHISPRLLSTLRFFQQAVRELLRGHLYAGSECPRRAGALCPTRGSTGPHHRRRAQWEEQGEVRHQREACVGQKVRAEDPEISPGLVLPVIISDLVAGISASYDGHVVVSFEPVNSAWKHVIPLKTIFSTKIEGIHSKLCGSLLVLSHDDAIHTYIHTYIYIDMSYGHA